MLQRITGRLTDESYVFNPVVFLFFENPENIQIPPYPKPHIRIHFSRYEVPCACRSVKSSPSGNIYVCSISKRQLLIFQSKEIFFQFFVIHVQRIIHLLFHFSVSVLFIKPERRCKKNVIIL